MTHLKNLLRFWYDFIVGDDWMLAASVVIALAVSAVLARQHLHAWWVLPMAVVAVLTASIWRATRQWPERRSTSASTPWGSDRRSPFFRHLYGSRPVREPPMTSHVTG